MSQLILKEDDELAKKLQNDVRRKLMQDYHHLLPDDSEDILPEYVKVLICNRKTKEQVYQDLVSFLEDEGARSFCDWLWSHIASLARREAKRAKAEPDDSGKRKARREKEGKRDRAPEERRAEGERREKRRETEEERRIRKERQRQERREEADRERRRAKAARNGKTDGPVEYAVPVRSHAAAAPLLLAAPQTVHQPQGAGLLQPVLQPQPMSGAIPMGMGMYPGMMHPQAAQMAMGQHPGLYLQAAPEQQTSFTITMDEAKLARMGILVDGEEEYDGAEWDGGHDGSGPAFTVGKGKGWGPGKGKGKGFGKGKGKGFGKGKGKGKGGRGPHSPSLTWSSPSTHFASNRVNTAPKDENAMDLDSRLDGPLPDDTRASHRTASKNLVWVRPKKD